MTQRALAIGRYLQGATMSYPALGPVSTGSAARSSADTVRIGRLKDADIDAMWRIFHRFYADVEESRFRSDLLAKSHVIVLRDRATRALCGFSTLEVYPAEVSGRRLVVVFNGDTILEPAYWGQSALTRAFGAFVFRTKLRNLSMPLYWFLISKGYRTYLKLTRFVPQHWPRHDRETPPFEQSVIDHLATSKFPNTYNAARGVLESAGQGRLLPEVAPIGPESLAFPDVRFFLEKNPRYESGEELVCIGHLTPKFFAGLFSKALRRDLASSRVARVARSLWGTEGAWP